MVKLPGAEFFVSDWIVYNPTHTLVLNMYFQDKIGGILCSRIDKMQIRPVWLHRLVITQTIMLF